MSAFEVDHAHIDALVTAGLEWTSHLDGPLRWMVAPESHPDYERAFQAGQPWGPGCEQVMRDCQRQLTRETAEQTGAMLVAENRRSVNHRYDEDELEAIYTFAKLPTSHGAPSPVVIVGALSCYEYQACETPDWRQSEAYAFCDALRHRAIDRMVAMLAGERTTWEITDRNVFLAQRAAS